MRPTPWKLWAALLTVYLIWGSTYLAIKVSVRTLPPLLSAGLRFAAAGAILAAVLALKGASLRVTRAELAAAASVGAALLVSGVGIVTVAETRIDSSVAAMIAGTVPLQVIALRTLARDRVAPATRLSVLAGLAGLALVVVPGAGGGSAAIGLALMLGATISWSYGSFVSRRMRLPADPFVATAWQMLTAAQRPHLAGRHPPVRQPDRGGRARRAPPRRGALGDDLCRRRSHRRIRLRRRPERERRGCTPTLS